MAQNNTIRNCVLLSIAVISFLMHYTNFNKELMSIHTWRQTQTQSTIINFYEEDMNILNPRRNNRGDTEGLFRMEFPLMQWLVACQYKLFGNHLFLSRFFMFCIGFLSVLGIFTLLQALFKNTTLSLFGAWAFNFSPSFYYYTINPLPDNLALCCSIWGLALFFTWLNTEKSMSLIWSGLLLSLGALCKLPFIIFYIIPTVYFLHLFFSKGLTGKSVLNSISVLGFAIFPIGWYATVIPHWEGNPVVKGMLNNEDSGFKLLDYFHHNLISTLPELLLNYGSLLFFLAGFYFLVKNKSYQDSRFILILSLCILALAYYFLEANAIAKIHDYYLFPFYPLLFILVGYGAYYIYTSGVKFNKYLTLFLLVLLPFTCYLRMQDRWDPCSPGFNPDLLIHKTELRNAVPKDALVVAGNDESNFIFFYYIDKKGWGYTRDELTYKKLQSMIEKGAEYLYTDSKKTYNSNELAPLLGKLITIQGTVRVYELRSHKD